jgi:YHS domain-containing protein
MIKKLPVLALSLSVLAASLASFAADQNVKPKPDKLTTCPVSGNKLGEMGKPYVFTYKDREVKLCCKECKKDFDKDPAKYLKLIEAADKNAPAKNGAKN